MAPHPRFQINELDTFADTGTLPLGTVRDFIAHQEGGRTFVFQTGFNESGIGRFEVVNNELVELGVTSGGIGNLEIATVDGTSYLYDAGQGLQVYQIGADGSLTSVQTIGAFPPFDQVLDVKVVTLGGAPHLLLADFDGDQVALVPVLNDGTVAFSTDTLSATDLPGSFNGPFSLATAEVGGKSFVYVPNGFSDDIVVAEMLSNGTFGTPVDTGISPDDVNDITAIVVDGTGYLIGIDRATDDILTYAINSADGSLTLADTFNVDQIDPSIDEALSKVIGPVNPFLTDDGRALAVVTIELQSFVDGDFVFSNARVLIEFQADGTIAVLGDIQGPSESLDYYNAFSNAFSDGTSLFQIVDGSGGMELLQITQGAELAPVDQDVEMTDRFIAPGDPAQLRFPLENTGDLPVEVEPTVSFYLSDDATLDRHEDLLLSTNLHFVSDPGDVDDFTFNVPIPVGTAVGTYLLFAVADADGEVIERDETNNTVGPFRIEVSYFDNGDNTVELAIGGTHNAFAGNDSVVGTDGVDTLLGGAGADTINGLGSADDLRGNGGNDSLFGGAGGDMLFGGDGLDLLEGNGSDDFLFGGAGRDTMNGNLGVDELVGGGGGDVMLGEQSIDSLYGGGGRDEMYGGSAGDLLFGGKDADELFGGNGNDALFGDAGSDALRGGANADLLVGAGGGDGLYGGRGADIIIGGGGIDFLSGGTGRDIFVWLSSRESGSKFLQADVVSDFQCGQDRINLEFIEVGLTNKDIITATLNDAFPDVNSDADVVEFIGTDGFTGDGRTSEVRWTMTSEGAMFQVDTTGNGSANMSVVLNSVSSLNADDFIL